MAIGKYETLIAFLFQFDFIYSIVCHMHKQINDKCCFFHKTKGGVNDHQSKSLTNYQFQLQLKLFLLCCNGRYNI